MSSKKDPKNLLSGAGQAGAKSVGAASVTFDLPDGRSATLWLSKLNVDTLDAGSMVVDSMVTDSIEAETGTFTTHVATNLIQPESGSSVSVDGDFTATNLTTTGELAVYTITRADGDTAGDIAVLTNLVLADPSFPIDRNLTAGDITAKGILYTDAIEAINTDIVLTASNKVDVQSDLEVSGEVKTDAIAAVNTDITLTASNKVDVQSDLDVSGNLKTDSIDSTDSSGPISFKGRDVEYVANLTVTGEGTFDTVNASKVLNPSGSLELEDTSIGPLTLSEVYQGQKFSSVEEAYAALEVGQTGVVESYDNAKEFGDDDWLFSKLGVTEWLASDTDGRYLYLLGDGEAFAIDATAGTESTEFVFNGVFGATGEYHAATNGDRVVFGWEERLEVFDVETGAFVFDYKDGTGDNHTDIWSDHRNIFAINEGDDLLALNWANDGVGGLDFDYLISIDPGALKITGYGEYLYIAYEDKVEVRQKSDGSLLALHTIDTTKELGAVSTPYDLHTDGDYLCLVSDNLSAGSFLRIYPANPDPATAQRSLIKFTNIIASAGKVVSDHRHIYFAAGTTLQVISKADMSLVRTWDVSNTDSLIKVVNSLACDGHTLFFAGVDTDGPEGRAGRLYLDMDPSAFVKVGPLNSRPRIFHNHLIPIQERNRIEGYREVYKGSTFEGTLKGPNASVMHGSVRANGAINHTFGCSVSALGTAGEYSISFDEEISDSDNLTVTVTPQTFSAVIPFAVVYLTATDEVRVRTAELDGSGGTSIAAHAFDFHILVNEG